jgi:hypothetical protein
MTQPDRTIHPAFVGIWATIREKVYKGVQECALDRRTVPVVDADDAAQSACLSIREAGASNGEKEWPRRQLRPSKSHRNSALAYVLSRILRQQEFHF